MFTDHGFSLNGKMIKLRGLDRHQTFPFVGQAMPARVQRKDPDILRKNLHCNIVRTSHYPNLGTSLTVATRSACWCSKRFLAGSILATKSGRKSRLMTSDG